MGVSVCLTGTRYGDKKSLWNSSLLEEDLHGFPDETPSNACAKMIICLIKNGALKIGDINGLD
jgi:hypothetical protein